MAELTIPDAADDLSQSSPTDPDVPTEDHDAAEVSASRARWEIQRDRRSYILPPAIEPELNRGWCQ